MDMLALFFPQGNDIVVTARYPDISDGTGQTANFYYKPDKTTPDTDPAVLVFESSVLPDEDNPGATISTFVISASDNQVPGPYWWRIDVVDALLNTRTANCGPLLVEAV